MMVRFAAGKFNPISQLASPQLSTEHLGVGGWSENWTSLWIRFWIVSLPEKRLGAVGTLGRTIKSSMGVQSVAETEVKTEVRKWCVMSRGIQNKEEE